MRLLELLQIFARRLIKKAFDLEDGFLAPGPSADGRLGVKFLFDPGRGVWPGVFPPFCHQKDRGENQGKPLT